VVSISAEFFAKLVPFIVLCVALFAFLGNEDFND